MASDLTGSDEPGTATTETADATEPATEPEEPNTEPAEHETAPTPEPDAPTATKSDSADGEATEDTDDAAGEDTEDAAEAAGEDREDAAEAADGEPCPEPAEDDHPVSAGETVDDPTLASPVSVFTKVRVLFFLAVGPLLAGYVAIAALLAIVTAIASNARFTTTGVLTAALPSWLAAHQVPVSIFGLELGVLPLLPTIGVAALTARFAARAAARLELRRPGQAWLVVGTVAVAHAVAGVVVAGLATSAEVTADPLAALYYPALVSALAATIGVVRPCRLFAAVADRADAVAVAGLRTGALAVVLLLTAGGAVLTFGLLTSISTARDLFPMGVGNAVGMLLLSVGYLPNAIVAATSFVAGPGFSLGSVMVSPLEFHGGRVPGVPLFAALPEHQAEWWPLLFVLPLAVGIVVGRRLRYVDDDPVARLRAVAVATGVMAMCFVVLAGSAGGRLGRGPFDPVSVRALALSIALVLWIAIPGAVTAWFGGHRSGDPLPGLIDDDELDEEDEDDDEALADLPGPRDAVEESGEAERSLRSER
jgi:hypothetical protein